jgi:hypothetical protein
VLQIEVHAKGGRKQIKREQEKEAYLILWEQKRQERLLNLKLSFNGCALKQNFAVMKRSIIIIGKLQLGLRSIKPKKPHGLRSAKWKQMSKSRRLKLGPSMKL